MRFLMEEIVVKNRVKLARVEKDFTQQQLADLVGVTRQTVNAIEANKYSPSLEVAFLIARALNVQIGEIFGCEEL